MDELGEASRYSDETTKHGGIEIPQKKYFGGTVETFIRSIRHRNHGQVNPAYEVDEENESDKALGYECRSNASSVLSDDELTRHTPSTDHGQDDSSTDKISANGRDFNVGFEDLTPNDSPPPFESPPSNDARRGSEKTERAWDRFTSSANDNFSNSNMKFWKKAFIILKVIIAILLFFLTLGTAVVSKLCFIIITANIFPTVDRSENHYKLKTVNDTIKYPHKATNVQWIWALALMSGTPYFFTTLRCIWRIFFQMAHGGSPSFSTVVLALLIETIHSVGLNLMMFIVIPNLDPISGLLMISCIGVIPAVLKIFYPQTKPKEVQTSSTKTIATVVSILGAAGQIAAIVVWCYHVYVTFSNSFTSIWYLVCLIISPICTSIYWWENFVHEGKRDSTGVPKFARNLRQSRTRLVLITSIWKMVLTIILPTAIYGFHCERAGSNCVRTMYFLNSSAKLYTGLGHIELISLKDFDKCNAYLPMIIAAIGVLCSGACFKLGKIGCKIMTQIVDYSLPLVLTTLVTFGFIIRLYDGILTSSDTKCSIPFPVWSAPNKPAQQYFLHFEHYWPHFIAGLIGFISFVFITNHVWSQGKIRLQRTDRLFVQPLYCGIFLEQSLLLNRRRVQLSKSSDAVRKKITEFPLPDTLEVKDPEEPSEFRTPDTPMIYMCGTMWHETENEMTQLLKSIFRMDEDQCTRRHAQFLCGRRDPDYYEFEAHIFFDDAFESHKDTEYDYTVNEYVKLLLKSVKVSAFSIYGMEYKMGDPQKVATPYGGRLVWKLPGNNKLIAHLKDKSLIRHRKRWSQVMYMYYFLGHQLLKQGLPRKKLQKRADNTFILALDGDVDFHPNAVQLLVDRMKKNPDVGAACGRIHPIGNGAMVWYQKFEYAVSHWLQKAAEDKFGCVLCSPGCFSLFRGSSLMDENVMNKYTTPPSEARHYVQYDQGEDRWLCTLLLQQGHRVEYCAASDALTYAPEGFYEFYNQRRRWTPSTMANILDLLTDWKNVTKKNSEITLAYIFYQGLLMVSSILTPGTIFLMILGAINLAYPQIDLWMALLINVIPIAIMILLCFKAKTDTQLTFAAVLSTLYSLIMMIVIVGLLRQAGENGICDVTTMFLVFVAGIFIMCAFLHPQEFWCIIHGFLYFLAIPSMSMLLMLFSLGNLHNVTWGTRENKSAADPKQQEEKKGKLTGLLAMFNNCLPVVSTQKEDDRLRAILDRLDGIENNIREFSTPGCSSKVSMVDSMLARPRTPILMENGGINMRYSDLTVAFEGSTNKENPVYEEEKQKERDIMVNPYWMLEDKDIQKFKEEKIADDEVQFWNELIEAYLKPLVEDKKKKQEIQDELIELRNKMCLIFILINSLFIIIVFSLQQVVRSGAGNLSIQLWCVEVTADAKKVAGQSIEPISVAFTLVFGVLLLIQFICMLSHRMATMLHILAATEIFVKKRKIHVPKSDAETGDEKSDESEKITMNYGEVCEFVRDLQKDQDADCASITSESSYSPSEVDDDEDNKIKKERMKARWKNLAKKGRMNFKGNTLGANFRKNFERLQTVIKDVPVNQTDEEDQEQQVTQLWKNAKLSRMRQKSFHFAATLIRNEELRQQIVKKNVKSRWERLVAITNMQNGLKKPDKPVNIIKLIATAAQIKKNDEDTKLKIPKPDLPADNSIDRSSKYMNIPFEDNCPEYTSADETIVEDNQTNLLQNIIKQYSPGEDKMECQSLKLAIPKVENDLWPTENDYAQVVDDVLF